MHPTLASLPKRAEGEQQSQLSQQNPTPPPPNLAEDEEQFQEALQEAVGRGMDAVRVRAEFNELSTQVTRAIYKVRVPHCHTGIISERGACGCGAATSCFFIFQGVVACRVQGGTLDTRR